MTEIGEEKYDFPKLLFQLSRKLSKTLKSSQAKLEGSSTFIKKFIPIPRYHMSKSLQEMATNCLEHIIMFKKLTNTGSSNTRITKANNYLARTESF